MNRSGCFDLMLFLCLSQPQSRTQAGDCDYTEEVGCLGDVGEIKGMKLIGVSSVMDAINFL